MEDVPKPTYLTRDRDGKKLRRTIPKRLQKLAGKANLVERVEGMSAAEIKTAQHSFAAWTSAEIAALERRFKAGEQPVATSETVGLSLTKTDAEHVAIRYFKAINDANLSRGDYVTTEKGEWLHELLSSAAEDYEVAREAATGQHIGSTERVALVALIDAGMLPESYRPHREKQERLRTDTPDVPPEFAEDRNFRYLCRLIERADVELTSRRLRSLQDGSLSPIADEFFRGQLVQPVATASQTVAVRKTVGELVDAFLEFKKSEVGPSRHNQLQIGGRALREHLGERFQVSEITLAHCKALAELLPRIPAYPAQHYRGLTLEQAAEAFEAKNGHPADRFGEAAKHMNVVRQILAFAVQEEWMENNPAEKVRMPKETRKRYEKRGHKTQPFTSEELKRILSTPMFAAGMNAEEERKRLERVARHPSRYWTPLIALYSGARMNEILQLERGDIREVMGVPYFQVTDEEEDDYGAEFFGKQLKTDNAVRDIPLHPELVRLGFLEWATAQGKGRLFPEATAGPGQKPSKKYSRNFQTLLKSVGVWVRRRKVFHSFRPTFNDAMRDAEVPAEYRAAIQGWRGQIVMDQQYGQGHKVKRLSEHVGRVRYEGLDLSHLYPGT